MPLTSPRNKLAWIGWTWFLVHSNYVHSIPPSPNAGQLQQELQQERALEEPPPALTDKTPITTLPPLPSTNKNATQTTVRIKGFKFQGNTLFTDKQLQLLVAPAIGHDYTIAELEKLADHIGDVYRHAGYLAAYIYLPEQTVNDGVLWLQILEGYMGQIQLHNTARISTAWLERFTHNHLCIHLVCTQQILKRPPLERALYLLTDIPGITARANLKPGKTRGTTDIIIHTETDKTVRSQFSFDNYGSLYNGRYRATANIEINNPLSLGDQLTVFSLSSGRNLTYANIAYTLPVDARGTRLGMHGSYMYYALGDKFAVLESHGDAANAAFSFSRPIDRSAWHKTEWFVRWQYNRVRDFLDVVPYSSKKYSSHKYTNNWIMGTNGHYQDGWGGGGITQWNIQATWGHLRLGNACGRHTDRSSARSAGGYAKLNINLSRLQALPFTSAWARNTTIYAHLNAQWATKNLHFSEKMGFSGPTAVRAYPLSEMSADQGVLATFELRYTHPIQDSITIQPFLFYDTSAFTRINRYPWQNKYNNERTLSGGGIGIKFSYKQQAHLKLLWAARTTGPIRAETDSRTHLWAQAQVFF